MRKIVYIFLLSVLFYVHEVYATNEMSNIDELITVNDKEVKKLNDNDYKTYLNIKKGDTIKISSSDIIKNVYIIYYMKSETGILNYNNTNINIGTNEFLHELVGLDSSTNELTINYNDEVNIKEIFIFNEELPSWVQKWEPPLEDADLLLFSAHSDDEHLFFAGLLPTVLNQGKSAQVVYLTRHENNPIRFDEQLNGLWVLGMKNYPIIGFVKDAYSKSLEGALYNLGKDNYNLDDVVHFEVDMIRRFKPEVVVNHDEFGEYGHGQHILSTYALKEALPYLANKDYESKYPPFEPYKIYLHLYKKHPIKMNYDIPLEMYAGKTAFNMSMDAFREHKSQLHLIYSKWFNYKSAKEIEKYSPLDYGLYYSTVGYENEDNNMFYKVPLQKSENREYTKEIIEDEPIKSISFKEALIIIAFSSIFLIDLLAIMLKHHFG